MSVAQAAASVSPIVRVAGWMSGRLVILIPAAMAVGLAVGLVADVGSLQTLVLPLTMLMVYPMLVNFRPSEALRPRDSGAVGLAMGLDFLVLPVVAWGLALLFFRSEPGLFVGMVLAGLFPTSGMTISWTGFAKGNVAAAVKMTVIGLILASLLAPLYLSLLAGAVVAVDMGEVLRTVLFVVGIPLGVGALTRFVVVRTAGETAFRQRLLPALPAVSTLGVLGIVFIAIALKARMIVGDPALVVRVLLPLIIFYAVNYAVATLLGRRFLSRADAIAVVYGTVMRNLSIALGVAMASFGAEAALVLAVAYVVQVQSAAWYVKATAHVFGPASGGHAPGPMPATPPVSARA